MHKDPDLVKKLDKMTPEQRKEMADKLRAEAAELEGRGEALAEQIRKAEESIAELRTEYDQCSNRAYHLRRLAYAVEIHQPDPPAADPPPAG